MSNAKRSMLVTAILASSVALGCSSSSSPTPTPTTTTSDSGPAAAADSGPEELDTGLADAGLDAPPDLKAPVITMLMQMTGGLHLRWTNAQKDCTGIEGERKSATEAYKVVFTIPDGSVDNKHDAPLTAGTMYTYRVRCKQGASYSPYSNEKSGAP